MPEKPVLSPVVHGFFETTPGARIASPVIMRSGFWEKNRPSATRATATIPAAAG